MSKQEKIVCAAVKRWVGDKVKIDLCVRYPNYLFARRGESGDVGYELGFITNKDRFVSQEEALEISRLGNQLRFKDRNYLKPEDLY